MKPRTGEENTGHCEEEKVAQVMVAVNDAEDEHLDEAEVMATTKEKPILQRTDAEQNGLQKTQTL